MQTARKRTIRQGGFTLTEVLVASAILVVIMAGALLLYERGTKIFTQGNQASEMQQNTRIAYDRMLADVRMAGFDYLRGGMLTGLQQSAKWQANQTYTIGTVVVPTTANGHQYRCTAGGTSAASQPSWPTGTGSTVTDGTVTWKENGGAVYQQPDEQIEYAGQSAITIRANFDYSANEPGDGDHGRESNLESTQFPIVTTGNDEIVTYALVSNKGPNNDTITFYADVNNGGTPSRTCYPGGNAERLISIPTVDLTNANPPYTLYRFTLADDGSVVRTPLADNIRSLTFLYFMDTSATTPLTDTTGAPAPNVGGGGQYDPANPGTIVPGRITRSRIRSVRVRLVGMNPVADMAYSDTSAQNGILTPSTTTAAPTLTTDTVAHMAQYRKMVMDTLVVPRNLGLQGMPLVNSNPPLPPTIDSVCYGYCGIAVVNWTPAPNGPLSSFVVQWDTSPTGTFSSSVAAGTANSWAVDLTQGNLSSSNTYYFRVMAQNQAGTALSTNVGSASVANATQPNAPTNFTATNGTVAGKVNVTWSPPTGNASGSPACTGGFTPANSSFVREVQGYRVYRDTNANFVPPGQGTLLFDENASGANAPVPDAYGNFTYTDTTAASCTQYYYRIQTIEWCHAADADNTTNTLNTAASPFFPATSNPGTLGQTANAIPQAPQNFQVDTTNSSCNAATNTCAITLNWTKVSLDTTNNPITIANYEVQRQTYSDGSLQATQSFTAPGGTLNTVTWQDTTALDHDPSDGDKYTYKYNVRAIQPPCQPSAWSPQVQYPPPCSFTGATIVEAGASSGDGLTYGSAWVMNAGDSITVTPPAGTTFTLTTADVYNGATYIGPLAGSPSAASPAVFQWADLNPGTNYTIIFTMTSSTNCTQQLTRYVQQETPPGCTLNTGASVLALLNSSPGVATTSVIRLDLSNTDTVALTLVSIDFTYQLPNNIEWDSVGFPSGNVVSVGAVAGSGSLTMSVTPKPAQLTTNDVTVPPTGTRSLTLNMKKTQASPNISTAAITSICVHYTRPDVPGQIFLCKILPGPGAGNPFTSCN